MPKCLSCSWSLLDICPPESYDMIHRLRPIHCVMVDLGSAALLTTERNFYSPHCCGPSKLRCLSYCWPLLDICHPQSFDLVHDLRPIHYVMVDLGSAALLTTKRNFYSPHCCGPSKLRCLSYCWPLLAICHPQSFDLVHDLRPIHCVMVDLGSAALLTTERNFYSPHCCGPSKLRCLSYCWPLLDICHPQSFRFGARSTTNTLCDSRFGISCSSDY